MPSRVLRGRRPRTLITSRSLAVGAAGTILAGAAVLAAPAAAQASAALPGPAVVPCSSSALVTAINQANSARFAVLVLARSCTYVLTSPATGDDGLPPVTGNIVIIGRGGTQISRSSATEFRIFDVAAGGRLTLVNLTVANGEITRSNQGAAGIQDAGTLVLRHVRLTGNTTGFDFGGALSVGPGAHATISGSELAGNVTAALGGAVSNRGDLVIDRSTLSGNSAQLGGAVHTLPGSTTRISRTVVTHNSASNAGGGIFNNATMVLTGDRVTFNQANLGGGIFNHSPGTVALRFTLVAFNTPDNCSPQGTIPGCRN